MDTLSHADWLLLHEATADLQGVPSLHELPARILEGLRRLIPCDSVSIQDDRGGADKVPWVVGTRPSGKAQFPPGPHAVCG